MAKPEPLEVRLLAKLFPEPNSGCWLWVGATTSEGYGKIKCKGKTKLTHRVSFKIHTGPIPPGFDVLQSCDLRPCGNPDHLFLGTPIDRIANSIAKDRWSTDARRAQLLSIRGMAPRGAKHWTRRTPEKIRRGRRRPNSVRRRDCRFTDTDREIIQNRYAAGESQSVIAADYRVTQSVISRLINNVRRLRKLKEA